MNNMLKAAIAIGFVLVAITVISPEVSADDTSSDSDPITLTVITSSSIAQKTVEGPDYSISSTEFGTIDYSSYPNGCTGHGWLLLPAPGLGYQLITSDTTVTLDPSIQSPSIFRAVEVYIVNMEAISVEKGNSEIYVNAEPDMNLTDSSPSLLKKVDGVYQNYQDGSNDGKIAIDNVGEYHLFGMGMNNKNEYVFWYQNITVVPTDKECTVTFTSNGDTVGTKTVKYSDKLTFTDFPRPERDGYALVDWTVGGDVVRSLTVTEDVTIEAVWHEINANVITSTEDTDGSVVLSVNGYDLSTP